MASGVPQRIISLLGRYPQGATAAFLASQIVDGRQNIIAALEVLEEAGKVESWRFIPERYRLASCPEDDEEAAAFVRLRQNAWPIMQELHAATGLPVSLHQLVAGGHTVVERCPDGPPCAALTMETARYATPASLAAGATSLAFMAFAPPEIVSRCASAASAYHRELFQVRADGFATSVGRRVAGAGAVTAPVLSSGQQPLGALCVYGEVSVLTPEIMARIGPVVALAAERLAGQSTLDELPLLAPMRRLAV